MPAIQRAANGLGEYFPGPARLKRRLMSIDQHTPPASIGNGVIPYELDPSGKIARQIDPTA